MTGPDPEPTTEPPAHGGGAGGGAGDGTGRDTGGENDGGAAGEAGLPIHGGAARWLVLGLGVVWFVVVVRLALLETQRTLPGLDENSDEFAHLMAFAGLSAVLFLALDRPRRTGLVAVSVLVATALLGLVVEVAQLGTDNRSFELSDLAFDLVGAWMGLATAFLVSRSVGRAAVAGLVVVVAAAMVVTVLFAEAEDADVGSGFDTARSCPRRPFDPDPTIMAGPAHLYALDEGSGTVAHDAGDGLDLAVGGGDDAWAPGGGLVFDRRSGPVRGDEAENFVERVRSSDEVSVEVWFSLDHLPQSGPARVMTLSDGTSPGEMNLHVGVEDYGVSFRIMTDCDDFNWIIAEDVLRAGQLHHVVATHRPGEIVVAVDGEVVSRARVRAGVLDGWDGSFPLVLGDEATGGRPMEGTIRRVALYDRAMSPDQITRAHAAGP